MWNRGWGQVWKMLWGKAYYAYRRRDLKTSDQKIFAESHYLLFGRDVIFPFSTAADISTSASLPRAVMTEGETKMHDYCKCSFDKFIWLYTYNSFSRQRWISWWKLPSQWEAGLPVSACKKSQSAMDAFARVCGSVAGSGTPVHSDHVTYFAHIK